MLDSVKNDRSRYLLMRQINAFEMDDELALLVVVVEVAIVAVDVVVAHSFYLNLVKGKTALASADADRDAPMLHAVRQRPIQAIQQRLNMLTDDAITQDHLESTALLGVQQQVGASMQDVLLMLHWVWA